MMELYLFLDLPLVDEMSDYIKYHFREPSQCKYRLDIVFFK